ncbi:MAG: HAD family hydrolase [Kyrpidia sp.]|nr:HAD family hydrolase [Kyrpidia sp.]
MPNIRMIVYDLDGTLYRDQGHFVYYRDRLSAAAPRVAAFERDYERIAEERHPLRVGAFYDGRNGRICGPDGVSAWDGRIIEVGSGPYDALIGALEEERDLGEWLYIGDLWWVMVALAAQHRVPPEDLRRSFLATRAHMMDDAVPVPEVPELREFVQARREEGVVQVLATNSPEPDSRAIIRKLGLDGVFDVCSFVTGKPAGLPARLEAWGAEFGVSRDRILMVGDNYRNDVVPARRCGCRTAFVDSHRVPHPVRATYRLRRLEDLFCLWPSVEVTRGP